MDKDTYKHFGFTQATRTEHTEMRICLDNFKGDKKYAENDTQQKKLNMSDKRLCYYQSHVFTLVSLVSWSQREFGRFQGYVLTVTTYRMLQPHFNAKINFLVEVLYTLTNYNTNNYCRNSVNLSSF